MSESGARRDHLGFSLYYFFAFAAVGFSTPFLPLYWKDRGLSYFQIGVLMAVAAAAGALSLVPSGVLSDRLHKRHLFIIGGSLLVAACFGVYPFLTGFPAFLVVQILIGIGHTVSLSVTSALAGDLFHQTTAGRSFSRVRSWGTVGFIAIMVVAYFWPVVSVGIRFLPGAAALSVLAALSILLISSPRSDGGIRDVRLRDAAELLRNRNTAAFVIVYLLGFMSLMPATANLSLYLQSFTPKPAPSIVPIVYAISATCELPFLMAMGWMADRYGRVLPMRICFIVLPIRLVLYSLVPSPGYVFALQATHGLNFSVLAVVPFVFMTDSTPPRFRATGQAVLNAAGGIANTVGPIVAGRVADILGIRSLYAVLGAFAFIGAIILFTMVREPQPPENQTTQ